MAQGYDYFVEYFCKETGIDLLQYKRPQMERRLTALRNKRGFASFEEYVHETLKNPALMAELLDRMTINVSEFYRNKPRWDALLNDIVPTLYRSGSFRVWSAACSTGEEPYTLALLLANVIPLQNLFILASDIDEHALAVARKGSYLFDALKTVPAEERSKYFTADGASRMVLSERIRSRVTFVRHNLLKDPFERNFDLIVCRNVLIYFTDAAKEALYAKFSTSLRQDGVLFVGSTEQVFHPEAYGLQQTQPFFYRRFL